MKKILFTVLIACISTVAFAQLSGGVKAGVNFSSIKESADGSSENSSGTSFHVGGYVNIAFSDAMSLQPELLYNSLDIEGDKLNYISVPVLFMYGFADNKFNVHAGPQLGLLISTDPSEIKDEDFVTGTDFTFNIGGGANFGKFNVTARYGIGLANIAGDFLTNLYSDYEIKTSNFQVSVGYKLFGE